MDGISVLIGDLDAELLLDRHHHLDRVQAVQAEVVGEVRSWRDLYGLLVSLSSSFPPEMEIGAGSLRM